MMPVMRPNVLEISAGNLLHNLQLARAQMPGSRVMAAIKANAYGHGSALVAEILAEGGVEGFAVASLGEAQELTGQHPWLPPCIVLAGPFAPEEIPVAAAAGHRLVLHCWEQIGWMAEARWQQPLALFLKLDSGMHRLGFAAEELPRLLDQLTQKSGGPLRILGFLSHLARADTPEDSYNAQQISLFWQSVQQYGALTEGQHSLPNSAAILALPQSQSPWIRPGLMLYGLSPLPGRSATSLGLRAVAQWWTEIIAIRRLAPGEWLGYGAAWRAERPSRIGIIACGYGDGLTRQLGLLGAPVWIGQQQSRLLGRVSMDLAFVDLTEIPGVRVGDRVLLAGGSDLPLEDWAEALGTIPYEVGTRITQRVPRRRMP